MMVDDDVGGYDDHDADDDDDDDDDGDGDDGDGDDDDIMPRYTPCYISAPFPLLII